MRRLYFPFSAIMLISLLVSCSSAAPGTDASAVPGLQPPAETDTSLAQERLKEAVEEKNLLAQQNRAFAMNYYELGRRDYENLKLESAKEHLQLALRYDPDLKEAQVLFEKVLGLLGERPDRIRTCMDSAVRERNIKTEQMLIEIENLISTGEQQLEEKKYEQAKESFSTALLMMNRLPYYVKHPAKKNRVINRLKQLGKQVQ